MTYVPSQNPLTLYGMGEAFQLLKTPEDCGVVFSDSTVPDAPTVVLTTPEETVWDREHGVDVASGEGCVEVEGERVKLNTPHSTVDGTFMKEFDGVVRIGYNVFHEIGRLLTYGQPIEQARTPSADLHIRLLRNILEEKTLLVEVPPNPWGHPFSAALTHDVEHIRLRDHMFDPVYFMILWRHLRGRRWSSLKDMVLAPFGGRDPWNNIGEYMRLESARGYNSTFYFIPGRKQVPSPDGLPHRTRPPRYDVRGERGLLEEIKANGFRVGVHGLNAWAGVENAKAERRTLNADGIRMHWLYGFKQVFGFKPGDIQKTLQILDKAGFTHDSTMGYSSAMGHKPGTTQAYRPYGADNILELPLHVMDNSVERDDSLDYMLGAAAKYGGTLTVLWHNSTLSRPLLRNTYLRLLDELSKRKAWAADSYSIESFYRRRRDAVIRVGVEDGRIRVEVDADLRAEPPMRLRVHVSPETVESDSMFEAGPGYVDLRCDRRTHLLVT